jgi:3-hydroxyisobutyrate dehydrogenase-like beta-hydroxyacid dehydrogenase
MADGRFPQVGVIGAGRMGQPIIGHMVRKGVTVHVHDVDAARRERVEALGASWAEPSMVARQSEVILLCVGYDRQVREIVSPEGLLPHLAPGAIVAILSTVHPATVRALAAAARPSGVHVVDATLCRGGRAADAGTLLTFVAGSADVAGRLEPVLGCFSTDIVRTGDVGTAQVAKAVNNMVMWACLVANHEALALAARSGMDVDALRTALLKTGAENYALRHWGTQTMAWAEDDLDIVQAMARDAGLGLPQAGLNREICRTLKPKRFKLDEYGV